MNYDANILMNVYDAYSLFPLLSISVGIVHVTLW